MAERSSPRARIKRFVPGTWRHGKSSARFRVIRVRSPDWHSHPTPRPWHPARRMARFGLGIRSLPHHIVGASCCAAARGHAAQRSRRTAAVVHRRPHEPGEHLGGRHGEPGSNDTRTRDKQLRLALSPKDRLLVIGGYEGTSTFGTSNKRVVKRLRPPRIPIYWLRFFDQGEPCFDGDAHAP